MKQRAAAPAPGQAIRAAALTLLAIVSAALTWQLRPTTGIVAGSPDGDVVAGCAWLAWVLAGYLALALAATAVAHLGASCGIAAGTLARLAPTWLRHLVDSAVTLGAAAAVIGSSTSATADTMTPAHVVAAQLSQRTAAGSALDWPGLSMAAPTQPRPARPPGRPPRVAPPPAGTGIVVQSGDTLWSIAARHLGPGASGADITAAWHAWYDANRQVIGPDPSLIEPGQRLVTPASRATASAEQGPTR